MAEINIFEKRPLFTACILSLLFSVIGFFLVPKYKFVIVLVALSVLLLAIFIRLLLKKISAYSMLCISLSTVMIIASIITSYLFFDITAKSFEKYFGTECKIEAIVVSERYRGNNLSGYNIIVTEINGEPTLHNATLDCKYNSVLEGGFRFEAVVIGEDFTDSAGGYNEKNAMHSDGVFINYVSDDEFKVEITEENVFLPQRFFADLNSDIARVFSLNLEEDTANMSSAILLGNKKDLPITVRRDFTRAGASHILALSGMHMSILMGFLLFLLKRFSVNRKLIAVILSVCALFYLFLTGMQISAARSVIMLLFVYLSWLSKKLPDPLTSLSLSGVILIFIMPGTVVDAGFWMSFAATLGILVYTRPFGKFINDLAEPINIPKPLKKFACKIISLVATSLFATVPLIIVLCIFIKQYSFFSILSSVILEIPTAGIILLSLLFLIFSKVSFVSVVLGKLLYILTHFMIDICAVFSDVEGAVISLNYPFATVAAIIITATLAFSLIVKVRNLFVSLIPYGAAMLLLVASISVYNYLDDGVKASYINASSTSDMIVLANNDNDAVICDVGNGSISSYSKALNSVYDLRATEIKALVLTKYTRAHSATLYSLFSSQKVRQIWIPRPRSEEEYYLMYPIKEVADALGVESYVYEYGDSLKVFEFTSIVPESYYIDRSVQEIVVLQVKTRKDALTYCAPAFNECGKDEVKRINTFLEKSEFIVMGNSGPKTKSYYGLPDNRFAETIVFSDNIRAAYYSKNNNLSAEYYIVNDSCLFQLEE